MFHTTITHEYLRIPYTKLRNRVTMGPPGPGEVGMYDTVVGFINCSAIVDAPQ